MKFNMGLSPHYGSFEGDDSPTDLGDPWVRDPVSTGLYAGTCWQEDL